MRCKLCDSQSIKIVFLQSGCATIPKKANFLPTALDFGIFYRIAQCQVCKVFFSVFDEKNLKLSQSYFYSVDELYLSQEKERGEVYKKVLSDIKPLIFREHPILLDVGCSYGFFLKLARDNGYDVYGVETSKHACQYCKEKFGLNIFCGEIREARLTSNFFDIVTALEVIEHIGDPREFIVQIKRILKLSGVLYLVTPNRKSLSGRLLGRRWWSYRMMHTFYFSKMDLCGFLESNGFQILYCKPYRKTFKFNYILRQLSKYNKFLHYILNSLTTLLRLKDKMITASYGDMIIVARKKY